jgi:hydrogenase/urease accessory protein HupE
MGSQRKKGTLYPLPLSSPFILSLYPAMLHAAGIASGIFVQKINLEQVNRFAGGAIALCGVYLAVWG